MKTIPFLVFLIIRSLSFAQIISEKEKWPNYPCTQAIPKEESLTVCADNQTYHLLLFRASYHNNQVFISGSKPDEQTMFPVFHLFVQTKGKPGTFISIKDSANVYGTFRKGGQEASNSQLHNGSCVVALEILTSELVAGTFVMTGYNQFGSVAKQITGAFRIKIKKE